MSVQTENKNVEKRAGNSPDAKVEFGLVDPRTLLVETNVRAEANLTPRFLKSVRDNGVLIAILVQRTEQGLRVRAGQRRTLAAIEEGLATIPAMIVQGDEDQVRRIREQIAENDDREDLRSADHVAAFEQLSLLGVPAVEIANTTGHSTSAVKAALKVAKTKKAKAVQAKYDFDLEKALVLAEFENDTEAIKILTEVAIKDPDRFEHTAQRLRDKRDAAARMAEAVAALAKAGTKQVTDWNAEVKDNRTARELRDIRGADGKALTVEAHAGCPHRAAYLSAFWNGEVQTTHVCLDYKAAGHKLNRATVNDTRTKQEKEAARAQKAQADANDAAWRSASTVRGEWLAKFAKRQTTPKDAATFLAGSMTEDTRSIYEASLSAHALACEWLGLKATGGLGTRQALTDLIAKSSQARALHIALVLALAAIEERTSVQTWRAPRSEARYFRALEAWGYTLDDVEQIARGPLEATKTHTSKQSATKKTNPTTAPATNPAPAARATKPGAQPKADNVAPVSEPAKAGKPGKTEIPVKDQAPAKPANGSPASATPAKANTTEKAQPTHNLRRDAAKTASTAPEVTSALTTMETVKQVTVTPQDQKQARTPQPATAGSR